MEYRVYIVKEDTDTLLIGVTAAYDFSSSMLKSGKVIVFQRVFDNPVDALAYKHLLEDLSDESLDLIISKETDNIHKTI